MKFATLFSGIEAPCRSCGGLVSGLNLQMTSAIQYLGDEHSGACFSTCFHFRYSLWRTWDASKPTACFIGMNPSIADHVRSDPTCTREINHAKRWGCGRYVKLNAFSYCTSKSQNLVKSGYADTPSNDQVITGVILCLTPLDLVVAGWGIPGAANGRQDKLIAILDRARVPTIYCFAKNQNGTPRHPLYTRSDAPLKVWRTREENPVPARLPTLEGQQHE